MFLKEIPWRIAILIFLGFFLQSCGFPGGDTPLKEKNGGASDIGLAHKKDAFTTKEPKGAATEKATFALG